jgi:hypothetical protein
MHRTVARRRIRLRREMPGVQRIDIIRHPRTGRDLRMVRPGGGKAFVERLGVEKMRLRGQFHPELPPDHHDPLMRPIGLVGREQIHVTA